MLNKIGTILFALFMISQSLFAGGEGTTGAQFLKLGIGARPAALGESFTGVADDINSLYWNPAGLAEIQQFEASVSGAALYEDIFYGFLGLGKKVSDTGGLGLGVMYLGMDKMSGFDAFGNPASAYTAHDLSIGVSYGMSFSNRFMMGLGAKTISQKIENESAKGFAVDFGALYKANEKLNFGASVLNIGPAMGFHEEFKLPSALRAGSSYKFTPNFLLCSDVNIPQDYQASFHIGSEYLYKDVFAFRVGFKTTNLEALGAVSALTAGFGLKLGKLDFDYALLPYGDLGITHRVSVTARLGEVYKHYAGGSSGPRIVIASPKNEYKTAEKTVNISGFVQDAGEILQVMVNRKLVERKRDIAVMPKAEPPDFKVKDTFYFNETVPLVSGANYISVEARNSNGIISDSKVLVLNQAEERSMSTQASLPTLWAVIIGINGYKSDEIQKLKYAAADAAALSDFFDTQKNLGIYRDIKKKVLVNEKANLKEMRKALGEFFIDAKQEDVAVIFIAGHGFVDKLGNPYLMAYDSDINELYSSALPMKEFQQLLTDRIPPLRTLVFADACHSGGIGMDLRGTKDIVMEFQRMARETRGKVILTASREREYSRENDEKAHGVFTYYLLEGLTGRADTNPKDNIVSLAELYDYVYSAVVQSSEGAQHPTLPAGGFDNALPLAVITKP